MGLGVWRQPFVTSGKKQNLENNNSFLDPKIGEFGAQKMGFFGGNFYQKSYF